MEGEQQLLFSTQAQVLNPYSYTPSLLQRTWLDFNR
jgi:hypothetical protein